MTDASDHGIDARAVAMLRALANPTRYRIVSLLANWRDGSSQQLQEALGLTQSTLFEHLVALRTAGVIETSGNEGRAAHIYCVNPEALAFLASVLQGLRDQGEGAKEMTTVAGTTIRQATADDADAIAAIYNQGIEDRVATLETTLRDGAERTAWMTAKGPRHPVLVATDQDGAVVGWASLNQFNPRPAYDHVADISVYVARDCRGRGLGDALLGALVQRARSIGFHKLVLAAFPNNAPGMRLYQRHGFVTVGIYHEQGMLDGRWVDTIVMEKLLS